MNKKLKILLIALAVLGIVCLGAKVFLDGQAGRARELNDSVGAYSKALAQIKAAELLGEDASGIVVPEEVTLTGGQNLLISLVDGRTAFLVIGIDLLIVGAGGLAYAAYKKKKRASGAPRKITAGGNIVGILIAFAVLCFNLALASPVFLTAGNWLNVSQQISTNFVVAVGMTFVIVSGGIDLSVGSNIALTGLLMAIMMKNWSVNPVLTILICIVFAGLIGLINGAMITYLNLPPFIATLGMMYVARGAAYTVTGGQPLYTMPKGFTAISSRVLGIPLYGLLIMLAVFAIGWYVLRYTRPGRFTFAIGGNENCARLSGISLDRAKIFVYTFSGLCCGVAALLLTSRLDSAVPTNADGQEMDAIAAVVIGGTSMKGGEGSMIGTLIGILIIGVISNGLNLLGVAQGPQKMVKGALIVIAVIIDVMRRRAAESAQ